MAHPCGFCKGGTGQANATAPEFPFCPRLRVTLCPASPVANSRAVPIRNRRNRMPSAPTRATTCTLRERPRNVRRFPRLSSQIFGGTMPRPNVVPTACLEPRSERAAFSPARFFFIVIPTGAGRLCPALGSPSASPRSGGIPTWSIPNPHQRHVANHRQFLPDELSRGMWGQKAKSGRKPPQPAVKGGFSGGIAKAVRPSLQPGSEAAGCACRCPRRWRCRRPVRSPAGQVHRYRWVPRCC